jgi:hypothetical protein
MNLDCKNRSRMLFAAALFAGAAGLIACKAEQPKSWAIGNEATEADEAVEETGQALREALKQDPVESFALDMVNEGRHIFRYDTFGDEAFWGGRLRLHEAIAGSANGGVGPGVGPATALSLGLRVDVQALPRSLRRALKRGEVDLGDPATTLALLKLDAVLGLKGIFSPEGQITSVGIQCALCHSVVDDSFAPGIGRRLDGWPNRDIDLGAIVAAAPDLAAFTDILGVDDATLRTVLRNWGRGRFDAFVNLDGKATRPDGGSAATMIPPLFGLSGVGLMGWNGWSGWGSWMPMIIVLELHGKGNFTDRRLANAAQFPVAAAQGYSRVRSDPDLVTPKLGALQYYVNSLETPKPPRGFYDRAAAARGREIFNASCTGCHVPGLWTTPGWNIVPPGVIGIDSFQADRSPNRGYRPPPLRGMFTRKNGFFHDGRFATLGEVVAHFNQVFSLGLDAAQQADLVEYVKSL